MFVLSPLLEPTLTLETLSDMLTDVKDWSSDGLLGGLGIPHSKVEELEKSYPDLTQRKPAIIKFFLDEHPSPSWELVCYALYCVEEYEMLEMVQNKYFKGYLRVHEYDMYTQCLYYAFVYIPLQCFIQRSPPPAPPPPPPQ